MSVGNACLAVPCPANTQHGLSVLKSSRFVRIDKNGDRPGRSGFSSILTRCGPNFVHVPRRSAIEIEAAFVPCPIYKCIFHISGWSCTSRERKNGHCRGLKSLSSIMRESLHAIPKWSNKGTFNRLLRVSIRFSKTVPKGRPRARGHAAAHKSPPTTTLLAQTARHLGWLVG